MIEKIIRKIEWIKIEHIFLFFALIWGLFQVFTTPPFQTPDEVNHYRRTLGLAFFQSCDENLTVSVPNSAENFISQFPLPEMNRGLYSIRQLTEAIKPLPAPTSHDSARVFTQFCAYNQIGYYPQTIGIIIGNILHLPTSFVFYLGRIFNVLVSIFLLYFAIKIAPFGKHIIAFVGLMPKTVLQLSSFSSDALTISGLILFISLILYFSQKNKISDNQAFLLSTISTLLVQTKPGYIAFILILLILKPKLFSSKKIYFIFISSTFILSFLLFLFLSLNSHSDKYLRPDGVFPEQQIQYLKKNPIVFGNLLVKNIKKRYESYTKDATASIGYSGKKFKGNYYKYMFYAIIILTILVKEKINFGLKESALFCLIALMTYAFIATLEYVFWNNPGNDTIIGIQGRYLIPLFPLLLFPLSKIRSEIAFNFKYSKSASITLLIVIFSTSAFASIHEHFMYYYF